MSERARRILGYAAATLLILARTGYAGLLEDYQANYPEAAAKLEAAYSHVTLEVERTRMLPPPDGKDTQRKWKEKMAFYREGNSCLCTRTTVESNDSNWPAGSVAYSGGSTALSFDAYRTPNLDTLLFNAYGADGDFDQRAPWHYMEVYAPFCIEDMRLSKDLFKDWKLVSAQQTKWDDSDAIEVVAENSASGTKRVNRFYFQPKSWAIVGWKIDGEDIGERIRYEPNSSPPRLQHIERWNGLEGEQSRDSEAVDVKKLVFGPVAKEKFTLAGLGLAPPPLDLIGRFVPQIADTTQPGVTCAVAADAGKVLDQIAAAYEKVKSAELRGTVKVVAKQGQTQETDWPFVSYFDGGSFRHEAEKRFYAGCDGENEYSYTYNINGHQYAHSFMTIPRAVAEGDREMYPNLTLEILDVQNPALGLMVEQDKRAEICRGAKEVVRLPDSVVDGVKCEEIAVHGAAAGWLRHFWVNAETGMICKSRFEISVPASKSELTKDLAIDVMYGACSTGEKIDRAKLAWHAPEGAQDLSPKWARLIGKHAPDISLTMLDGKKVELSSFKGSIVVLDFWATWCGPCRKALPHLEEVYKANKDGGLQVFALDFQEKAQTVATFIKAQGMTVPVALDEDGTIFQKYGGGGIPMTVIIGKEGTVKSILVGYSEKNMRRLTELVAEGMEERKR